MPARRLMLAAALALLALALIVGINAGDDGEQATRPPETAPAPGPGPATVAATLPPAAERPPRVNARVGDLVRLEVFGRAPDSVSVEGYDAVEAVDAQTPARFEFVADRPGSFRVRFSSSGRLAGVLVVRARRGD